MLLHGEPSDASSPTHSSKRDAGTAQQTTCVFDTTQQTEWGMEISIDSRDSATASDSGMSRKG